MRLSDRTWLCRIIGEHGLKASMRSRKPRTNGSTHGRLICPNLVKEFTPAASVQLCDSEQYIVIADNDRRYHFYYLSLVFDAYSKEIVGWSVGLTSTQSTQ